MNIADAEVSQILERVQRIETTLAEHLPIIAQHLEDGRYASALFRDGMEAFAERRLKEAHLSTGIVESVLGRARRDPTITYPQRKLLEALASLYDYRTRRFGEISFSKLVRLARVSKSRAKWHLKALEDTKLVRSRTDFYRVYYKISEMCHTGAHKV
jgi:DNA-binding transcriptional ArsR family regulator